MSRAARFTQDDVTRALKGALAAGVKAAVFIDPTGRLAIVPTSELPSIDTPGDIDARLAEFAA